MLVSMIQVLSFPFVFLCVKGMRMAQGHTERAFQTSIIVELTVRHEVGKVGPQIWISDEMTWKTNFSKFASKSLIEAVLKTIRTVKIDVWQFTELSNLRLDCCWTAHSCQNWRLRVHSWQIWGSNGVWQLIVAKMDVW